MISASPATSAVTAAPRKLPLLGIFIAWTLWGIWSAQQSIFAAILTGESVPARTNPLSVTIISASFWALISPAIMTLSRHVRDAPLSTVKTALAHVGAFLVVQTADVTMYWIATKWLTAYDRPFIPMYFSLVTFNALAYLVVAASILALDAQEIIRTRVTRESQLETQLALAQFHALRAQLHPHFLFNALNAVSSLIHSDPHRADRMLSRISELLRTAIATAAQPEIPLGDEMEFNRRYLEVERMRYGDRLSVHIEMATDTIEALVPSMLLQPLVENAVRHGIAPHSAGGRVEVASMRRGDKLCIVVRDTGNGFDDTLPRSDSGGVGLSTTEARLHKLYGDAQQLELVNVDGGCEVRVTVPFHVRNSAVP